MILGDRLDSLIINDFEVEHRLLKTTKLNREIDIIRLFQGSICIKTLRISKELRGELEEQLLKREVIKEETWLEGGILALHITV
ncbi:hypothetical protein [Clostridium tertium]|uniref:hypothetical protein n=1 Tax=Clostridium tertium TaxID=1559 RepID=UPI0023B2E0DB|nr:hypothetical protein [Clostridium tertium]